MSIDPNNLAATAKLTFSDEFNSLSLWNGTSGTWSSNWWYNDEWGLFSQSNGSTLEGNGESQWYINDNYAPTAGVNPWSVSNGVLSITADRASANLQPLINNYEYTSGMLNSWHSFSQTYGYFEISAKLPAGQGLWPAFWLLQEDGDWPPEIDVFEVLGHETDRLYQTVHTDETGEHTMDNFSAYVADMSAGFHRYGVNWQADYITFYFDGVEIGKTATPADLNEPMYLIVNLAVGGGWPGEPDATTKFPATLQVDYVRVYSDIGAAAGGGTTGSTGGSTTGSTGGTGATTGTVTVPTTGSNAIGSAAPESLKGTNLADQIFGEGGNDFIIGYGGEDYLRGGDGNDEIYGGAGFDDLNGNAGNDTIEGEAGSDWVVGGKGDDLLYGGMENDIVLGNLGRDTVDGETGQDTLRGGQEADAVFGGDGNDWLSGDRGYDELYGGPGADIFHGSADCDVEEIIDFSRAEGDRIQLDAGTTYAVSQSGADTIITLGGGSAQMILVGVQASSLAGDWLFFV